VLEPPSRGVADPDVGIEPALDVPGLATVVPGWEPRFTPMATPMPATATAPAATAQGTHRGRPVAVRW